MACRVFMSHSKSGLGNVDVVVEITAPPNER